MEYHIGTARLLYTYIYKYIYILFRVLSQGLLTGFRGLLERRTSSRRAPTMPRDPYSLYSECRLYMDKIPGDHFDKYYLRMLS